MVTKVGIVNPPDLTVSIPVDIRGLNDTDSSTDPIPGYPVPSACSSNSGALSPEGPGVSFVLLTSPLPTNTEGEKLQDSSSRQQHSLSILLNLLNHF